MIRRKLIRVTTVAGSLDGILKGQLGFLNKSFEVVGIASGQEILSRTSQREGIRTINVEMKREISLLRDVKSLISLIKIFRRERPFIVHASTPKASLLSMVAAWIARTPNRIYTVTGVRFETTKGMFRTLLKTMERLTCLFATKVIPEGDGVKATLLREHITGKPLEKILNGSSCGVDTDFFRKTPEIVAEAQSIKSEFGVEKNAFVFGFVGRIVRDKGVNELVRAFARVRAAFEKILPVRLFILGNFEEWLDPVDADVRAEILSGKTGIIAPGYKQDLRPYYAAMDTFVLPSYREGFGTVILEAGAMDLPCIISDRCGPAEIMLANGIGIIVPAGDENSLFAAMKNLVAEREKVIPRMVSRAREVITSRYERRALWEALLKTYKDL